jgi:hypothetical protein
MVYLNYLKIKEQSMEQDIAVTYPEALAFSLKMQDEEFSREMKNLSMVKLYELGDADELEDDFAAVKNRL